MRNIVWQLTQEICIDNKDQLVNWSGAINYYSHMGKTNSQLGLLLLHCRLYVDHRRVTVSKFLVVVVV